MDTKRPGKLMLFGIDSATPELTMKFVEEGALPNIEKLIKRGVFCNNALPAFPTLTPSNWTTIATGATPGTHGITDFTVHHVGEPLDKTYLGFTTEENSAEYIWNAAARAGKRSILMKYTASWPPRLDNGVQIDGCVPNCGHHICRDHLFVWQGTPRDTSPDEDETSSERMRSDSMAWTQQSKKDMYAGSMKVVLGRAGEWASALSKDALEGKLVLTSYSGQTTVFHILVEKRAGKGYDTVSIFSGKDPDKKITEFGPGKWSGWIPIEFGDSPALRGETLCKCLALAPDATELRLYFLNVMPQTGYSQPEELALELAENIPGAFIQGPPIGAMEAGWIDPQTFCEAAHFQADWYSAASIYLLKKEDWDLFFIQTHAVDHCQHSWFNTADPHTAPSREKSDEYMGYLKRVYQAADKIIGRVIDQCADEDTLVVVVSDHGAKCYETLIMDEAGWDRGFAAREVLKKAGLGVMKKDPGTGKEVYDWSKTRAAAIRDCFIYVNLKGRDPEGIVEPGEEYDRVVEQAITAMRTYIDPKLGLAPFSLVLKREDARILGHYTQRSGDIVYSVDERYAYTHGQQLPASRLGIGSMRFLLIMAGHLLKKDLRLERNLNLVDVTPTICHIMKLPIPKNCEGAIIYQALENPDAVL